MSGNFYRILGARIVYIGSCPTLFYPLSILNKFQELTSPILLNYLMCNMLIMNELSKKLKTYNWFIHL
jgi:hypothetical protein